MEQEITEASVSEKSRTRQKPSVEAAIARKMEVLSQYPNAMVLAPKTTEGRLMINILYGFDRAINSLRLAAGGRIKISEVVDLMADVTNVRTLFEQLAMSIGGSTSMFSYESDEEKRVLALRRESFVFSARTDEGQRVASIIKKLDPRLLQLRATCTDFTQYEEVFANVKQLVKTMDEVTEKISKRLDRDTLNEKRKTNYYSPRALAQYLAEDNA